MEKIEKSSVLSLKKADAAADIELINTYSRKKLTPEEVYCFSVILCDNEVDRDYERFPTETLEKLSGLFVGKTGISDHRWEASGQVARLYRAHVEKAAGKNRLGEPLYALMGSAYMLRTENNQPLIEAIEGGIVKEVSIACAIHSCTCSICGEKMCGALCENGHRKGEEYEGRLCVGELNDPTDAYEFSFVAVPAQPGAGVTKSLADVMGAVKVILAADISGDPDTVKALSDYCRTMQMSVEEREQRKKLLLENQKFLEKEGTEA